jgi:hypothetical protein
MQKNTPKATANSFLRAKGMVFFSRVISFKARSNRAVVDAKAATLCKTAEWGGTKDRPKTTNEWSDAK